MPVKLVVATQLNTIHGWAANSIHSSSLSFRVRFNEAVTSYAATLDTRPRARSYPGGNRTHLSMKHFQFAPASHAAWCGGDVSNGGAYPISVRLFSGNANELALI